MRGFFAALRMTAFFRDAAIASMFGLFLWAAATRGLAQQQIGSVGVADATVSGALEVSNGRAILLGASTVTAKDRTTPDLGGNRTTETFADAIIEHLRSR